MSTLEEIKARASIVEVIGRRIEWDRAKSRPARGEYWACCPFHGEKTASFQVRESQGKYHCFGCGEGGDALDFIQAHDRLDFREALARLAEEVGMEPPARSKEAAQADDRRKKLQDIMERASRFYQAMLMGEQGSQARTYAELRGLSAPERERFGIGFAPKAGDALWQKLKAAGISLEDAEACGLVHTKQEEPRDVFVNRLMFPVRDPSGKTIAFGGRALNKNAHAKYINSPEGTLFSKKSTLYHFGEARKVAPASGLLVVEGYTDVIACARAGVGHAVAPMGTALTEEQMVLLWKCGGEPLLCFDGDDAGRRAAEAAAARALPLLAPGRTLRFCFLPQGQDPDSLVATLGSEGLTDALSRSRSLADVLWAKEFSPDVLDNPDRRSAFARQVRLSLKPIDDGEVREAYKADFEARLAAVFAEPRRRRVKRDAASSIKGKPSQALVDARARPKVSHTVAILVRAAIEWPEIAEEQLELLVQLPAGPLEPAVQRIAARLGNGGRIAAESVFAAMEAKGETAALAALRSAEGPMRAIFDVSSDKPGTWQEIVHQSFR